MTRRLLVAGNWKLNGSLSMTRDLISEIKTGLPVNKNFDVAVFPPIIFIPQAVDVARDVIILGAQSLSEHDQGAYTGEISGVMLSELGCQMVLVGHSERRAYYHESNQDVAKKFQAALKHGLKPILCCGETLEQRESGVTEKVVAQQIDAVIDLVGIGAFANAVIAYEPVWAIGTGKTASSEQAQSVHAFIRSLLSLKSDTIAPLVPILYGGSVKGSNA
ncbi:MAG: triose-phosphate isomerase, partial [Alcanivoracaceae bacterium]|nr:triose-phosphate isomerase [Alcanivoracaceae bacterium]